MVCLEKLENCHFNPIINRVHHASSFLASTVFPYRLKILKKLKYQTCRGIFYFTSRRYLFKHSIERPLNGNESLFI